jgi:DNA-binding CsgD family transcriptional regulator
LCRDLTEENLRMCAYFKIGMTTKQLAQLLHIIPRSVIINRYRLKKKLQLSDSENLDDFIRNL